MARASALARVGNLGQVSEAPIVILYEHPLWFEPLFAELERRGVPYAGLHANELCSIPASRSSRTDSCSTG